MTVKLYAMTCGYLGGPFKDLMEGGEGRIDLPIPSFLIEHPKGRALYDTGMHPHDDYCALWHMLDLLPEGAGDWQPRFGY